MENKSKELEVAIQAALEAGEIVKKHFQDGIVKEQKENADAMMDVVTQADRESEALIKKIILENFPEHSFIGEETGTNHRESNYAWYVDPVDGTANFASGIPMFGICIALAHNDEVLVAVTHNPVLNEILYAEKGKGTYLNDKKIHVSHDDANIAMFTTGTSRNLKNRAFIRELSNNLANKVRYPRNFACSAMELSYVARGSTETHIVTGLGPHDFAAGSLLVKEAGGKITKFDGSEWKFPYNYFIASNGVFHDLLVEEVQAQVKKLDFKEI